MPESENIEWKVSWRDEYLKWVCAFANTKGGKIFIGKDDNGLIVGLTDFSKLMEDIPNKIQNHIGITSNVSLHDYNGKRFIEIDVYPYDVAISYHGKYYYRTGSVTKELTGSALNEFLLKKSGRTWDDIVEPRAKLTDLDQQAIKAINYLKTHNKITNNEYQSLNICSRNTATRDLSDLIKKDIIMSSAKKGSGSFYYLK